MSDRFQIATLQFARATRRILARAPQGLTGPELRDLNAGIAALEAATGAPALGPRQHPQPAVARRAPKPAAPAVEPTLV